MEWKKFRDFDYLVSDDGLVKRIKTGKIIKQHENNGQQIASEDELRSVFDENGRFTIYKGMSSRSIFCRNALMKSIDKRKNKDLDLVMVNEMMQKISDKLGVVYRLALRELGADLSLKNNFQSPPFFKNLQILFQFLFPAVIVIE